MMGMSAHDPIYLLVILLLSLYSLSFYLDFKDCVETNNVKRLEGD